LVTFVACDESGDGGPEGPFEASVVADASFSADAARPGVSAPADAAQDARASSDGGAPFGGGFPFDAGSTPTGTNVRDAAVTDAGPGGHETDAPRVSRWLERLQSWHGLGLRAAYFFVHQPDDIAAPQLLSIAAERAQALGIDVPSVPLERPAPNQLDLFG
jgi:hypothetical protein